MPGTIGIYLHHDKRQVAVLELNCESDFAEKKLKIIADDLAMHLLGVGIVDQSTFLASDHIKTGEKIDRILKKASHELKEYISLGRYFIMKVDDDGSFIS